MSEVIMTLLVIAFILFIFFGCVAVILDQRAEARHWQQMWKMSEQENRRLKEDYQVREVTSRGAVPIVSSPVVPYPEVDKPAEISACERMAVSGLSNDG